MSISISHFPLPSPSPALFSQKEQQLSSAIINLLCAFHMLVFLTCGGSADHVTLSMYCMCE